MGEGGPGWDVHADGQAQGLRTGNDALRPWRLGVLSMAIKCNGRSCSHHLPCDLKQEDVFVQRKKQTPTYSNLPFQSRDDLSHHPYQVLVLVCVVSEPHSLSDRQNLFADEPGMQRWGVSPELRGLQLREPQGSLKVKA